MSNEVFFKPSLNLDSFFGDEFFEDNERFLLFLKAYYEWLQTTRVVFTNKTGTFQRGEQVVGATSKATGIIKEVKIDSLVIQVTTKKAFAKSETITGQTSTATATIYSVKDNVVRASGNVVDYRSLDNSIDKYFEYLKDELYTSLPVDFYGNKPLVASKFKDFFNSKSNEQSYRFLFRLLYNEEIDFYYPGDDIIRSSDGNFEKTQVIRTTAVGFGVDNVGAQYERNIFDFLNKTIRGKTSGALAFVVDIKKFFIGSIETAEMTLRLVSADFDAGEEIVDIDDEDLNATVYGIVAGFTINDGGSGYQVGDTITIAGDGSEAQAVVSSIRQSPITALKVNTIGHGYRLGTTASINNSGTGGTGLIVRVTELANTYTVTNANTGNTYTLGEVSEVSVINRGSGYFASPTITLIDSTIESLGLLSDKLVTIVNPGTNYHVGDSLVITANTGANAVGQIASVTANATFSNTLLFEDGFEMLFEQSYDDVAKTEDWDVGSYGPIARIEFTNFGDGYIAAYPPTITVNTSTGANASLTVVGVQGMNANVQVDTANNLTGIGSIRAIEIKNFGIDYSTATANASSVGDGNANLTPIISGIGVSEGNWLDDDGKVSFKILQDSYYYQDYSYVIKSGLTVEKYIDTIKKSIHPAGLQVFGEILLIGTLNVTPEFRSAIETIKDFIVRIYDFVSAEAAFGGFDITIETTIESFFQLPVAIIPNTDIATQEYVIQVVQGGDDINVVPNIQPFASREIRVIAPNLSSSEMEIKVPPIRKMYISTTDTHQGYTLDATGGLGDRFISEFASDTISTISEEIFGGYPGSLSQLGEKVIFLVPGGGDVVYIENLTITSRSLVEFDVESYLNSETIVTDVITREVFTITNVVDGYSLPFIYGQETISVYQDEQISLLADYDFEIDGYGETPGRPNEYNVEYVTRLVVESNISHEYVIPIESLGFANSEFTMIIASSAVVPQKLQTAESVTSAYGIQFKDILISEIAGESFDDLTAEQSYQNLSGTNGEATFNTFYRTYPFSASELILQVSTLNDISEFSVANREIVVRQEGHGFKFEIIGDALISEYETELLSSYENVALEQYLRQSYDVTIKMSPSPFSSGQSGSRQPTDVFRGEYLIQPQNDPDAYDTEYGDVRITSLQGLTFEDVVPGTLDVTGTRSFDMPYPQSPTTIGNYIKYTKITGTVSSSSSIYSNITLDDYSEVPIDDLEYTSIEGTASVVIGSGTNFLTDFDLYDIFVANNEYFTVEAIANTTFMTVDRLPAAAYSNIFAYKQV